MFSKNIFLNQAYLIAVCLLLLRQELRPDVTPRVSPLPGPVEPPDGKAVASVHTCSTRVSPSTSPPCPADPSCPSSVTKWANFHNRVQVSEGQPCLLVTPGPWPRNPTDTDSDSAKLSLPSSASACSVVSDSLLDYDASFSSVPSPLSMGSSRQEYWSGFAISFSRGASPPRDPTCNDSCISCNDRPMPQLVQCGSRLHQVQGTFDKHMQLSSVQDNSGSFH